MHKSAEFSTRTLYGDSYLSADGWRHSVASNAFVQIADWPWYVDNQQRFGSAFQPYSHPG